MRSVPRGSFERVTSLESLWLAWLAYRRGKRRRPRVAAFDVEADAHVCRLHRELVGGGYRPGAYHVFAVRDPKVRLIAAPYILAVARQNEGVGCASVAGYDEDTEA